MSTGEKAEPLSFQITNQKRESKQSPYLRAVAVVAICACLAKLMLPYLEPANVVMLYLLAVIIVASRYGRGPSILASILSVATFDFFCVPPYFTFAVSDTQYLLTFAVMLVVALLISNLTVTIKQQSEAARLRESRAVALYLISQELSATLDMTSLVAIGLRHIGKIGDSRVALLLAEPNGTLALAAAGKDQHELIDIDFGVAGWVHLNKRCAGLGTDTLPGAGELYLPLLGAQRSIGVLVVCPLQADCFMWKEEIRLLETFANQIALACERAQLSEEAEQVHLQMKTEQIRSSLLSAVSHDLRTPLATITGAASSIMEATDALTLDNCKQMVKEIYDESMRLNRLVGNLLDMTKLQSGNLQLVRECQAVDEVIGAAISYMEERIKSHVFKTLVPTELLLISADAILIHQVLLNLIENATKYAPIGSEIEIAAGTDGGMVLLSVADRGPGITAEAKGKIFEKFYREHPGTSSGAGLGLAICSGIVEAHAGQIWVEDRPGGGAIFKFRIPSATAPNDIDFEKEELSEYGANDV
jgi:two-component system sensor histidine kinase KdpD